MYSLSDFNDLLEAYDLNRTNIQQDLLTKASNTSVPLDPKPQVTFATDGKQSGSTLFERDVAEKTSCQLHEKPKCQICGKLLSGPPSLKRHLRIHSDETPYECEHCCKKFKHTSALKRHLMIHSGEAPYQCQDCSKKFSRLSSLKRHLRIHSGETPYQCRHCSRKYRDLSNLNQHLQTHSDEAPYECEHCCKKLKYSSTLKRHLRIIHPGETPDNKKQFSGQATA